MFPSPDFKSDASTGSAMTPFLPDYFNFNQTINQDTLRNEKGIPDRMPLMEVPAGVEPALTELQSVALPLG